MEKFTLSPLDIGIMVVYVVAIIWYGLRHAKRQNAEGYFLAGRNMTWPIVGISLFAANISSNTLTGLASSAYNSGINVYNYEWMAAVVLVFFALFFLPFYLRSKVYTMPEFLEKRYDSRSRYYFSFITIVGNIIIDTASALYAGNLVLKLLFPTLSSSVIILILALAAAAYTIPGGLSSVVHTEVIQAILLVIGSTVLTFFAFSEVGGWNGLMAGLDAAESSGILNHPKEYMLSLTGPIDDPYMPWTGMVFGVPILGFYFWANNQFMVQRVLSAKDLNHGRLGALFAGLLKLPVILIMVVPGLIAIVLYNDLDISVLNYQIPLEGGGTKICENLSECPNMTYPVLLFKLLPTGLLGLVIAGLLAAMSSSISATLNSASTLITMDFVAKMRPNLTSTQLVRVGQIATVALVILAAAWAPFIENFPSLFDYLQQVLSYIAPPVVGVFLLGLFWKRANATGAFASLMAGFLLSIFMILSSVNGWVPALNQLHFLHIGPLLMLFCMAIQVVFSLVTPAPPAEKTDDYIWTSVIFKEESAELAGLPWYKNYRILSVILLAITLLVVGICW
ncbi:MAG: sodium:solute symporter [Bacteroidia bacterium]|nr:sodium:solute symporter [Bacteroidia bacterium]